MKVQKVIIGTGIMLGLVLSVVEYRAWKYEETKSFGQGPTKDSSTVAQLSQLGQAAESLFVFDQHYINPALGIRLRYPVEWELSKKSGYEVERLSKKKDFEINKFLTTKKSNVLSLGKIVSLDMYKNSLNLSDWVDIQALGVKHRSYVISDRASFILWTDGKIYKAYTGKNGVVYEFTFFSNDLSTFEKFLRTVTISL